MRIFLGLLMLWISMASAFSEETRVLKIGVHEKPPYATKDASGEWQGLGIELWKSIAAREKIAFQFVEMPFEDLIPAVRDGRLDAAVGEMEVTAENERNVRFTQPYLRSSIGVATGDHRGGWALMEIAGEFFNWTLVQVLLLIFGGMLLVSMLIWFFEKNHHVGHFKGGLSGFGSALWFAAVTMTTVGYGDKTPSTLAGRLISFVWMLVGLLLVASFTAAVAASAATARISQTVVHESDLVRMRSGVLRGSFAEQILRKEGYPSVPFESLEIAFDTLPSGRIQTVVADRNSLFYLAKTLSEKNPPVRVHVTPVTLRNAFIGIPTHPGLPEFEAINIALLATTASDQWQGLLRLWLGNSSAMNP